MLAPSLLSLTLGSQVRGKCRGETMQEWSRVKAGSREVSVQGLEGSGAGRGGEFKLSKSLVGVSEVMKVGSEAQ